MPLNAPLGPPTVAHQDVIVVGRVPVSDRNDCMKPRVWIGVLWFDDAVGVRRIKAFAYDQSKHHGARGVERCAHLVNGFSVDQKVSSKRLTVAWRNPHRQIHGQRMLIRPLSLHWLALSYQRTRGCFCGDCLSGVTRSEEHTSELQSRGLISYAVFCLKKKKT